MLRRETAAYAVMEMGTCDERVFSSRGSGMEIFVGPETSGREMCLRILLRMQASGWVCCVR